MWAAASALSAAVCCAAPVTASCSSGREWGSAPKSRLLSRMGAGFCQAAWGVAEGLRQWLRLGSWGQSGRALGCGPGPEQGLCTHACKSVDAVAWPITWGSSDGHGCGCSVRSCRQQQAIENTCSLSSPQDFKLPAWAQQASSAARLEAETLIPACLFQPAGRCLCANVCIPGVRISGWLADAVKLT